MTCGGCSGAVTRALTKIIPPSQFEVNLESQTVKVFAGEQELPPFETVTEKIAKTGKEIRASKAL
ncbi:Copper chaperone [Phaffia rhodozyma]|uniref:Copper chaperone n=1 Tax=Phaffia rhodozyma TaxID=264483 RepID=A0A0F7SGH8_PHARH|nr:Copper chaperone [Phaffia rhodozyma]